MTENNGGHFFVPISAKWLVSGDDDEDDDDDVLFLKYLLVR